MTDIEAGAIRYVQRLQARGKSVKQITRWLRRYLLLAARRLAREMCG